MEIKAEELKKTLKDAFEKFQKLETEILAYSITIRVMEETGAIKRGLPWDDMQAVSRLNPLVVKMMADKYGPLIEGLMQAIDQGDRGQAFAELLRKWKPSGPIN
jgi:hypothetical protein